MSAATLITGAAGIGDSLYHSKQIKDFDRRITKIEKSLEEKKIKPYVPSYVNMDLYKKGLYDK